MRITVLSGGIGGARFLSGLLDALGRSEHTTGTSSDTITVIGNTADDVWMFGLQDLPRPRHGDVHARRRHRPRARLGPAATRRGTPRRSSPRTASNRAGSVWATATSPRISFAPRCSTPATRLSAVTAALCERWQPGVTLLPMTDDRVETHVVIEGRRPGSRGRAQGRALPGVLGATARADRPCGDAGRRSRTSTPALASWRRSRRPTWWSFRRATRSCRSARSSAVPGIADAVRRTPATVVGVSPDHRRRPGPRNGRQAAAGHRRRRDGAARSASTTGRGRSGGLLDGWLVDEADAAAVPALEAIGIARAGGAALHVRPGRSSRARPGDAVAGLAPSTSRDSRSPSDRPRSRSSPWTWPEVRDGDDLASPPARQLHPFGRRRRRRHEQGGEQGRGPCRRRAARRRDRGRGRPRGGATRGSTVIARDTARAGAGRRRRRRLERRGRPGAAAARRAGRHRHAGSATRSASAPASTWRSSSPTPRAAPGATARSTSRSGAPACRRSIDLAGATDGYGNPLAVTAPAMADEVASAADLVKGKLAGRPVAVLRGLGHLVLPVGEHGAGRRPS